MTTASPAARRVTARGTVRLVTLLGLVSVLIVLALAVAPALIGFNTLVITSGSMGETAPTGSVVVARPVPPADIRVGMVVLLQMEADSSGQPPPVLHRVIEVQRNDGVVTVRTKGDANAAADPEAHEIRGSTFTPVYVLPYVGRAVAVVGTPLGWFAFVLLPATLLYGHTMYGLLKPKDQDGSPLSSSQQTQPHPTSEVAAHAMAAPGSSS